MRFGELIRCFRCFFNKEKEREKNVCGLLMSCGFFSDGVLDFFFKFRRNSFYVMNGCGVGGNLFHKFLFGGC